MPQRKTSNSNSESKSAEANSSDVQKVEIVDEGAEVQSADTAKKQSEGQTVKTASSKEVIKQAEGADIKLSDTEKSAIEVATGEAGGRKYKLADPKTQYGEDGFTLAGDQEKELPADPSDALIARIRSGFIIEA